MAKSAENTIEVQRQMMAVSNKAYLVIVNPSYDTFVSGKDTIQRVTYFVRNAGNTFAYNVTDAIIFEYQRLSCEPNIPTETNKDGQWLFPPGDTKREIIFKQVSPIGECQMFFGDIPMLYFSGRIEYTDIFNEKHWLTFCFGMDYLKKDRFFPMARCNDTDK